MLAVKHQVAIGDPVRMQHAVRTKALIGIGDRRPGAVAVDGAVDDHMGEVDAAGAKFARHALRSAHVTDLECRRRTRHDDAWACLSQLVLVTSGDDDAVACGREGAGRGGAARRGPIGYRASMPLPG